MLKQKSRTYSLSLPKSKNYAAIRVKKESKQAGLLAGLILIKGGRHYRNAVFCMKIHYFFVMIVVSVFLSGCVTQTVISSPPVQPSTATPEPQPQQPVSGRASPLPAPPQAEAAPVSSVQPSRSEEATPASSAQAPRLEESEDKTSRLLGAAIKAGVDYLTPHFPVGGTIAVVAIEAPTENFSLYIIEELMHDFSQNNMDVIERRHIELLTAQLEYDASGRVSDASAQSIGQQLSSQTIVYGRVSRLSDSWRLALHATNLTTAQTYTRVVTMIDKNADYLAAIVNKVTTDAVEVYSSHSSSLTVWNEDPRHVFYDNDRMIIYITADRDCYLKVSHIDVNGMLQVIYPGAAGETNFIKANEIKRIPDDGLMLRLKEPFGAEYILVNAYDAPFITPESKAVPVSQDVIKRGYEVVSDTGALFPFATVRYNYTILP
jgi:hypothetical protein